MRKEKTYEDILGLPHHVSASHPHMPRLDRAAQFSPFAALTGYEEAIQEEGRLTSARIELDEDTKGLLDQKLQAILARKGTTREVLFTCFRPDGRKEGGAYITLRGCIKRIDSCKRTVILEDGTHLSVAEIVDIQEMAPCPEESEKAQHQSLHNSIM